MCIRDRLGVFGFAGGGGGAPTYELLGTSKRTAVTAVGTAGTALTFAGAGNSAIRNALVDDTVDALVLSVSTTTPGSSTIVSPPMVFPKTLPPILGNIASVVRLRTAPFDTGHTRSGFNIYVVASLSIGAGTLSSSGNLSAARAAGVFTTLSVYARKP